MTWISVNRCRWYAIVVLVSLGGSTLITAVTLLQLNLYAMPWPTLLVPLWQSGFQLEILTSMVAVGITLLMGFCWWRGGVERWIAQHVIYFCVILGVGLSIGLWWFRYQTGLTLSIMPWSIIYTYTGLQHSPEFLAYYFSVLGVSSILSAIIGTLLLLMVYHRDTTLGDARFANPWDIQKAKLYAKEGVLLGKAYGKTLCMGGYESVLVVAPTGSGKTTSIAIPNLYHWKGSTVVNDLKGELYLKTHQHRKQVLGQTIYCWSPGGANHGPSHRFNPFAYVRVGQVEFIKDLQFIAYNWIQSLPQEASFWPVNSRELFILCALYSFATQGECTFGSLYDIARREDFVEWLEYELVSRTIEAPLFYQYAASLVQCDEKTRSNILKDFHARLEIFNDPIVRKATEGHDMDLRCLRKEPMTIYVNIPDSDRERLKPLLALLYAQLIALMTQQEPSITEEPLGVLLMLDEFGNMGCIPQLKAGVSFLRSYRVRVVMMVQYLGQLTSVYGQTDAKAFLNSKVKCVFALNDKEDAKYFAECLGRKTIKLRSYGVSNGHGAHGGSTSHNTSLQSRYLLSPDKLVRLASKQCLLLVEGHYPIKGNKVY